VCERIAEPKVRIRSPPAVSLQTFGSARDDDFEAASGRAPRAAAVKDAAANAPAPAEPAHSVLDRASTEHYGVVHRNHPETIFRVRIDGLKPRTTYYYKVTSMETNGKSDGVMSAVNQFTTPGPSERIVAYPPQPIPRPR